MFRIFFGIRFLMAIWRKSLRHLDEIHCGLGIDALQFSRLIGCVGNTMGPWGTWGAVLLVVQTLRLDCSFPLCPCGPCMSIIQRRNQTPQSSPKRGFFAKELVQDLLDTPVFEGGRACAPWPKPLQARAAAAGQIGSGSEDPWIHLLQARFRTLQASSNSPSPSWSICGSGIDRIIA